MAGRAECCRYEASLEDLLDDDVMEPVLRSAGSDSQRLRDMMAATARRIDALDEARDAPDKGRGKR